MICLARSGLLDAGQLHEDLILAALPRDDRLGDAQLVDAALDRLQRLVDRLPAQLVLDVRLHAEGRRPRRGAAVEDRLDIDRGVAKGRLVLNPLDTELARRVHGDIRERHAGPRQRVAHPFGGRFRFDPHGIVGLDSEDQMHAALQVEAEIDLLVGRIEGPDRQGDHRDGEAHSPPEVLHHCWLPWEIASPTGSCPW